jgi:hypothetical protein
MSLMAVTLIAMTVLGVSVAHGQGCVAPPRPFVPGDPVAVREYADLIRADFETYLADVQSYFRCLDAERARAFEEAREVSEEYARFIATVRR